MLKEFKKFALRGNVIDMAVGIVVGTAFKDIIDALVTHIIMPPLNLLIGGVDFSGFGIVLRDGTPTEPPLVLNYGILINTIINFLIIAFVIFVVVRQINKFHENKEEKEEKVDVTPEDILLLREIRDQLKKK